MPTDMTLKEAAEIVLTLAADGVLTNAQVLDDPEVLQPEQDKQKHALAMIQDFLNTVMR